MRIKSLSLYLIVAVLILAGCAGKSVKPEDASVDTEVDTGAVAKDITVPPKVVKRSESTQAESDPDETVSFEDWSKRRREELKDNDEGDD